MNSIESRSKRNVSLKEFETAGTPLELGEIDLNPNSDFQYILRMPIRIYGGEYTIPEELEWVRPMFERALNAQLSMGIDHPFCYITIRHGEVISKTDDEWHVDGFSVKIPHTPEQNYIWCDVDATEYADISVKFPQDFDARFYNVNHYLQKNINPTNIGKCEAGKIYCMDPYNVHRRPPSAKDMKRTFIRISFVPIEINDVNNTQNPMLPHQEYDQDGVVFRNNLKTYG